MKDEQFYKKIRGMVNGQLNLETHLEEIQHRQNQKSKIQDSNPHGVEELNNKKMTRAALAKRNQQTQEQLRKDQIYVRLTPRSQNCLQWMLCNRNFPRIECKLSCNQHIEYLANYLSNKWLRGKGHSRIVLYPDEGSFLKSSLPAKQRQKIAKQPLNNYFMFTDVMVGSGIGQNGILNLRYDILEKKSQNIRGPTFITTSPDSQPHFNSQTARKTEPISEVGKRVINLEQIEQLSRRQSSMDGNQEKHERLVPLTHNNSIIKLPSQLLHEPIVINNKGVFVQSSKNNTQSFLMNNQVQNNQNSNHFLSNESNLLNPNRSIYHDQESIFKSIGFFGVGGNGNSIGFTKRNDFNMISINSNSYLDIQDINEQHLPHQQQRLPHQQQKEPEQQQKDMQPKIKGQKLSAKLQPRNFLTQKAAVLDKNDQKQRQSLRQHSKSNQKSRGFLTVKQQSNPDVKQHQQKLIDLRNAINFVEQTQGFNQRQTHASKDQVPLKQARKEIKTVSIKKKTCN